MPGVVTNSRSRPSSLKNPWSRATSTGRSCTAFMIATWGLVLASTLTSPPLAKKTILPAASAIDARRDGERLAVPRRGNVFFGHVFQRLEYLEVVVPALGRPERDHGVQRREAGGGALHLAD